MGEEGGEGGLAQPAILGADEDALDVEARTLRAAVARDDEPGALALLLDDPVAPAAASLDGP